MSEPSEPKRILIVDDTKDILLVVSRRLKSWGYEPLIAESGEEGLQIAEEKLPDLVLLDIMMPKMKGRDVCARLTQHQHHQRVPQVAHHERALR